MIFSYKGDPLQLPALTLAYLGDAVYELYIRKNILDNGTIKVNELHNEAVKRVKASTQAELLMKLENRLTEEEWAVARRGRNAKSSHIPKNADMTEYRKSTGFEALIGYLFLKQNMERIEELLSEIEGII